MVQRVRGVEYFLRTYDNPKTRAGYRGVLTSFFRHINPELETDEDIDLFSIQYVQECLDDTRDLDEDLLTFKEAGGFGQGTSPVTKLTYLKKFLDENKIEISPARKKAITRNARTGEARLPTREELIRLLGHLDLPYRALILVLATTGVRVDEALNFKLSDVKFKSSPIKIKCSKRGNQVKGRAEYVFITEEAGDALSQWIGQRDKLVGEMRAKAGLVFDTSDKRIFPFRYDTFNGVYDTARKRAGLDEINEANRSTINIHSMRRVFRSSKWANPDVAKALMGHKEGVDGVYNLLEQNPDYLAEEYQKNVFNLTITDEWRAKIKVEEQLVEAKQAVEENSEQVQKLIINLTLKNQQLEETWKQAMEWRKSEDEEWKETISKLVERVKELEKAEI